MNVGLPRRVEQNEDQADFQGGVANEHASHEVDAGERSVSANDEADGNEQAEDEGRDVDLG